ncbi:MAG: hypothetical protein IGS03_08605 [Candidatus Sericytochromatia bacterium]|nr:hypothetical protein [Candidatus Sericytochromatia bacterium]
MRFPTLEQAFQPLICKGSGFERGRIQGSSFQKPLQLCFNALLQSETTRLFMPRFWPESWARRQLFWQSRLQFQAPLQKTHPDFAAHLQGLAAGAELPENLFFFLLQFERLLSRLHFQMHTGLILMVPPRFSATQEPMLLHNLDHPYFLKAFGLFRQSEPDQGLRSLEMTLLPMSGTYTGMNEAGLAIAVNAGFQQQANSSPFPLSLKIQQLLQQCEKVSEAISALQTQDYQGGGLVALMDRQGDMALVESANGKFAVRPVKDQLLMVSNHYQITEMLSENIPVNAYFSLRKNLASFAGKRVREASESRLDRIAQLMGTRVHFHAEDLLDYARDHGDIQQACDNTICRHGSYYETTYSALMQPRSRRLWLTLETPCEQAHQVYQWY